LRLGTTHALEDFELVRLTLSDAGELKAQFGVERLLFGTFLGAFLVIGVERRIIMNQATQQNRLGRVLSAGLPEFDNLFNQFFRAEEVAMWRAPASIWEADNMFHIEIDAPSVMKEDVELTFDKGALQVTLERKAPEGERTNWHNERGYGKVSRSVSLPETVDPNTITAELTNGVLHVTITKLPEAQPKKIDVKVS
jgi:HSP20 family protein